MAKRQAEKKCFIGFWFDFRFGQAWQLQYNTPEPLKSTTICPNNVGTNEILLSTNSGQRRTNDTNFDVDGSCAPSATSPRISGMRALVSAFPSSTPHWS